jgi:hypothetical protein
MRNEIRALPWQGGIARFGFFALLGLGFDLRSSKAKMQMHMSKAFHATE